MAGWVFAHRPSNRQRNTWVVSLLSVQPADRVLEIGFGPGVAVAELVRAGAGHVYGIDHSGVMVRQASRRNAAAIRAGRVTLINAPVDQLPAALHGPFDAILAVNSFGFWPAPADRLAELRQRLAPGRRIALASQPRCVGATADTSRNAADEIQGLPPSARPWSASSPPPRARMPITHHKPDHGTHALNHPNRARPSTAQLHAKPHLALLIYL